MAERVKHWNWRYDGFSIMSTASGSECVNSQLTEWINPETSCTPMIGWTPSPVGTINCVRTNDLHYLKLSVSSWIWTFCIIVFWHLLFLEGWGGMTCLAVDSWWCCFYKVFFGSSKSSKDNHFTFWPLYKWFYVIVYWIIMTSWNLVIIL